MAKTIKRSEFSTSTMSEIKPNESLSVICNDAREVHNVRLIAAQYRRLRSPEGISRYASVVDDRASAGMVVTLTAMP